MDPEAIRAALPEQRVELRSEHGQLYGVVVNQRWLEVVSRESRDRKDGVLRVYVWDLVTGRRSVKERPKP